MACKAKQNLVLICGITGKLLVGINTGGNSYLTVKYARKGGFAM